MQRDTIAKKAMALLESVGVGDEHSSYSDKLSNNGTSSHV